MDKTQIIKSLSVLAEKIEAKFNTTILRKIMTAKPGAVFSTVYPIDNTNLKGGENNVFGPNFPSLKSFDASNYNVVCTLLIPIQNRYYKDLILDNNLNLSQNTMIDIIHFCGNELFIDTYDGGKIKMSYEMKETIDTDTFYCTKDSLITPDIYLKFESVEYGRLLYYL